MAKATNWIRPDLHTVTPRLVFKDAQKAVKFYEKAFGAKKRVVALTPDTKSVIHAEMQIGDSVFFLVDEIPHMECLSPETTGGAGVGMALATKDVDAAFKKAVDAGCQVKMPVVDMFWGDRFGVVKDPFGHIWELSTHVEDLNPLELDRRAKEAFSQVAKS